MEIILVNEPYYLTGFAILKGLPSHYPQTHNAGTADLTSKNHTRTKVHLKWREKVEVAAASSTRTEKRPLAVGDFPSFRRLLAAGASSARGSDQSGYRWRRRSSVEASHCRVQRRLFRIQEGEARQGDIVGYWKWPRRCRVRPVDGCVAHLLFRWHKYIYCIV